MGCAHVHLARIAEIWHEATQNDARGNDLGLLPTLCIAIEEQTPLVGIICFVTTQGIVGGMTADVRIAQKAGIVDTPPAIIGGIKTATDTRVAIRAIDIQAIVAK